MHDVRVVQPERADAPRVHCLLYGTQGFLERLGIRSRSSEQVPWNAILRIRDGVVVVDAGSV